MPPRATVCSAAAKLSFLAGGPAPEVPPHPKMGRTFHFPPGLVAKLPGASSSGSKIRVLSEASGLDVGSTYVGGGGREAVPPWTWIRHRTTGLWAGHPINHQEH